MLNSLLVLTAIALLAYPQMTGEGGYVQITVVLKVAPWNTPEKINFRAYVNGSSNPFGEELVFNASKALSFKVPKGSYVKITGELEIVGDYGFWYRLDNVNGTGRSIEFKAECDSTVYLNYSTNHVLLSPYFIAVYILLALLAVRKYLRRKKTFKKAGS